MTNETENTDQPTTFTVGPQEIPASRIANVLCSALDPMYGYSYCWCRIVERIQPTAWVQGSEPSLGEGEGHYLQDFPFNPGGALLIGEDGEPDADAKRLDWGSVQKGLEVMAGQYSHHYADILQENDDAITGDLLLQLCLFGEEVYA